VTSTDVTRLYLMKNRWYIPAWKISTGRGTVHKKLHMAMHGTFKLRQKKCCVIAQQTYS
jgi:hypothetical protein